MVRPLIHRSSVHLELPCHSDYNGALAAGFNALLLRRQGPDGHHEHKEMDEDISRVNVIHNLDDLISRGLEKPKVTQLLSLDGRPLLVHENTDLFIRR